MTDVRVRRAPHGEGRVVVHVPGSKSIANRALVCGSLATGTTRLDNVPAGDDTRLLLEALRSLGVPSDPDAGGMRLTGPAVDGAGGATVDAGLGGTTARFLCALAAVRRGTTVVRGSARLLERPMGPLFEALERLGADVEEGGGGGVLARITGADLVGGSITVSTDVSSQFTSALMMIGPVMRDGLTIELRGEQRSRSYIDMTADVMRAFGASVDAGTEAIVVRPGRYQPQHYTVEADYSSAAFPVVAAALTGRALRVPGVSARSIQGDRRLLSLARQMACEVNVTDEGLLVDPLPDGAYPGFRLDLSNESDLVPPMTLGMLGATSTSSISGVGFIRGKESNRLEDFAAELRRCGLEVAATPDGLEISPTGSVRQVRLDPRDDHRLAMAFALVPLLTGRSTDAGTDRASTESVEILRSETVSKSWPGYWSDMAPFIDVESLPS